MGEFDNIMEDLPDVSGIPALIMVAGVGGAGGNTVDHMWEMGINGVNLVVCNTDIKALKKSPLPESQKICLGDGLGAGNEAEEGARKTKSSIEEIRQYLQAHKTKMLFIVAGMGGGTGTGASPVIAQLAHEMGILTVAIVTMPPMNEGPKRMAQAKEGLERMREWVDSLIVLSNESIIKLYDSLPVEQAFGKAHDVPALAAKGIAEIVMTRSNLVSVDFSDVKRVMTNSGCAVMGVSSASGDNRAIEAIEASLSSPLFGGASIAGAKNVLINFAVAAEGMLTIGEVNRAIDRVQEFAGDKDEDGRVQLANVIWGTSIKPELEDKLEIIIVVTGFPSEYYTENYTVAQPVISKPTPSAVVETPPTTPVTTIPPVATPSKLSTPIAKTPSASGQSTLDKHRRSYAEVYLRKSVPAFRTRKVEFITETVGRGKRVVEKAESVDIETTTDNGAGASVQSLF